MRRQMAAAGKKNTTSLSSFVEIHSLQVEEEFCTMAIQYWAEGVWTGKWQHETKEAWRRHEITIDMGYVCPKDVRKMLVQRARSVYWKKWAAKHEYE